MYVEQNATDGDTEVVISGTAGDEGLRRLYIKSPARERMTTLLADDATPGMREFHFETPEPPGEAVLAFYPEGTYVLQGISTSGERFRTVLTLSHDLPPAVTILHPAEDFEVPARQVLVGSLVRSSGYRAVRARDRERIGRSGAGVDREPAAACDELPRARAHSCGPGRSSRSAFTPSRTTAISSPWNRRSRRRSDAEGDAHFHEYEGARPLQRMRRISVSSASGDSGRPSSSSISVFALFSEPYRSICSLVHAYHFGLPASNEPIASSVALRISAVSTEPEAVIHHVPRPADELHAHGPPGDFRMRLDVQVLARDVGPQRIRVGCAGVAQHADLEQRPGDVHHHAAVQAAERHRRPAARVPRYFCCQAGS